MFPVIIWKKCLKLWFNLNLFTKMGVKCLDVGLKNSILPLLPRMWRNWQTRRLQVPVGATSWRFKSSHPHDNSLNRSDLRSLFLRQGRLIFP
jgi:hypothetical protein